MNTMFKKYKQYQNTLKAFKAVKYNNPFKNAAQAASH